MWEVKISTSQHAIVRENTSYLMTCEVWDSGDVRLFSILHWPILRKFYTIVNITSPKFTYALPCKNWMRAVCGLPLHVLWPLLPVYRSFISNISKSALSSSLLETQSVIFENHKLLINASFSQRFLLFDKHCIGIKMKKLSAIVKRKFIKSKKWRVINN